MHYDCYGEWYFFEMTGLLKIHADEDLVMICNSMAMLKNCARMCEAFGLVEGANDDALESYIVEHTFVG
ncbi:ferredoxin-NADP reductase [Bartonella henselae]|uniref:Ferredoxin-NADP reductase n=1 Tax=Bartonella henselae TaxID=38323 RepID=X5MGB8_BARHN|nr:ferredoxin-NADP reductase [Bartonella henselae]